VFSAIWESSEAHIDIERPLAPEQTRTLLLSAESELEAVRESLRTELSGVGAGSTDVFDCLVAVTEACSNALRHGRGDTLPLLRWTIGTRRARFSVQDFSGVRRSPSARTTRRGAGPKQVEEERIGGFGVRLMRGLMDEVDIRSRDEGTTVSLVKVLA
jgi:anti-sigma regulatory factor (Ser/Thr protein kinase)